MNIGTIGIAATVTLAAVGSAFGIGAAGMSAIGAMKKSFMQNKTPPFLLIVFIAAPLTQIIYGFILLIILIQSETAGQLAKMTMGILGGTAMGFSAFFQGKVGANASDALGETGKGFGNYIMAIGLVETVALFVMVFLLITASGVFGPLP